MSNSRRYSIWKLKNLVDSYLKNKSSYAQSELAQMPSITGEDLVDILDNLKNY